MLGRHTLGRDVAGIRLHGTSLPLGLLGELPLHRIIQASDKDGCHRNHLPQVISNRPQEAHREPCHWIMKTPEPGGNVYTSSTRP